jgi:hypothetical protein
MGDEHHFSYNTKIWKTIVIIIIIIKSLVQTSKTKKLPKKQKKKPHILQLIPDMFEEQVYTKRRRSKVQRAGC